MRLGGRGRWETVFEFQKIPECRKEALRGLKKNLFENEIEQQKLLVFSFLLFMVVTYVGKSGISVACAELGRSGHRPWPRAWLHPVPLPCTPRSASPRPPPRPHAAALPFFPSLCGALTAYPVGSHSFSPRDRELPAGGNQACRSPTCPQSPALRPARCVHNKHLGAAHGLQAGPVPIHALLELRSPPAPGPPLLPPPSSPRPPREGAREHSSAPSLQGLPPPWG